MGQFEKLMIAVLCGSRDKDISFRELCKILETLGFSLRVKGSHHIYYRNDISEILNLQAEGSKAKPYQVIQVRQLILKYKMGGEIDV
jgi:predicted RNA binding protein YcfA (HicA-like mRNA interferase family)